MLVNIRSINEINILIIKQDTNLFKELYLTNQYYTILYMYCIYICMCLCIYVYMNIYIYNIYVYIYYIYYINNRKRERTTR